MINYAYLNARVSILAERLLSEAQIATLLKQPLGTPLKKDSSKWKILQDLLKDNTIDHALIEQAWLMRMITDFQVLTRPLSGTARELLMYWFRKWDMANLKTIVRGRIAGLEPDAISALLIELGPLTALPIEQLLRTEDIGELLRRLEKTPHGSIARQVRRVFEKNHQQISIDATVDRHYLLGFVQRVRILKESQSPYLLPLVSILMDRFNLLWLLRYRFVYDLSAAETYYLLVPTPYQLNRNRLRYLVELNSLSEVLAHLPEPLYTLLFEADSLFSITQRLTMETRRIAELILKLQPFTLAKVFAYILLREMEMRRVMAIIKGKKLNLDQKMIALAVEQSTNTIA